MGSCWFAFERIRAAAARDDTRAEAFYQQAIALKNEGRLDEAEASLKMAVESAVVENPEYYRALGKHYQATRRCRESLEWYAKAIEVGPELEQHLLQPIAWCHMQLGDPQAALRTLEKLKTRFPQRYTPRDEQMHETVLYEVEHGTSGAKTAVVLQYVPKPDVGRVEQAVLRGNWGAEGHLDDAHGYAPVPLERDEAGTFRARVELEGYSELPYQAVVTSTAGRVIGYQRFRIDPEARGTQFVTIASTAEPAFFALTRASVLQRPAAAGDGKRRMFILWPDCGSWWFVRFLMERGQLPNLRELYDTGARGVMISDPPLTSIAMERLTSFAPDDSWWGMIKRQLKGIQGFDDHINVEHGGENSLAARLAEHGVTFVDLTFNEAFVQSKTDASSRYGLNPGHTLGMGPGPGGDPTKGSNRYELTVSSEIAPDSVVREWLDASWLQMLSERISLPQRVALAHQWDDAAKKFRQAMAIFGGEPKPDAMLLRLPSYDVMTHSFFENTDAYSEQLGLLEAFYTYLDQLSGEVRASLDADDILLVISDHGARDAIRHDPIAMILGAGPGLPAGAALPTFPIERFPTVALDLIVQGALPAEIQPH